MKRRIIAGHHAGFFVVTTFFELIRAQIEDYGPILVNNDLRNQEGLSCLDA